MRAIYQDDTKSLGISLKPRELVLGKFRLSQGKSGEPKPRLSSTPCIADASAPDPGLAGRDHLGRVLGEVGH